MRGRWIVARSRAHRRDPERIDAILGALRDAISIKFTVKTRVGFADTDNFDELLTVFARHSLDLVTVHGRTVAEMYRAPVHYDLIARAVASLRCPVLANGDIFSPHKAEAILQSTGARGLAIGRGAIRNPWLFNQIRQKLRGEEVTLPTGRDVLGYIHALYEAVSTPDVRETSQVQALKKYLSQIALGVDAAGQFLDRIRRVRTRAELFCVCEAFLAHGQPLPLEPFPLTLDRHDILAGEQP